MEIVQVLDAESSSGSSNAVKLGDFRFINGPIPVMVYGTFTGTVVIEGTIATDEEVALATAVWLPLVGGSFTSEGFMGLFSPVSHLRVTITISAGDVSVRLYV